MRRRFVIGAAPLNNDQVEKLREYLDSRGAWWNWIGDMWLFTTTREDCPDAKEIRDFISNLNPKARIVVLEFPEDINWASFGSKPEGGEISEWLVGSWGKKD